MLHNLFRFQTPLLSGLVLVALTPVPVLAGAAWQVDDPAITPAGACLFESAWRGNAGRSAWAGHGACTFGSTELGIGRHWSGALDTPAAWSFAIKRPILATDDGTALLALTVTAHWEEATNERGDVAIQLPWRLATLGGVAPLHANLGWTQSAEGDASLTWGLGTEVPVSDDWGVLGEFHRPEAGRYEMQWGLRRHVNAALAIDALVGIDEARNRWLGLGLSLTLQP